jgi:CubicO group peptidase (beta-lactamase class C family)
MVQALAASAPLWPPGSAHAYHPLTYGWLAGELIRRISGSMPGEFFAARFGQPLGLSTWIGVPDSELGRVARVLPGAPAQDPRLRAEAERVAATPAGVLSQRAATINGAIGDLVEAFNDPAMLRAQVPAANGVSTARSLARLYSAAVTGPDRAMTPTSVTDAVIARSSGRQYLADTDSPMRWGTGFMLSSRGGRLMLGPRSFGHDGAGGKAAFADDEYGVGFAYLNNWMGQPPDNRADRLIGAFARCLGVDRLAGAR